MTSSTRRGRDRLTRKLLTASAVPVVLGLTLTAPAAQADRQTEIDAMVKQSIVYVAIGYTAWIQVPGDHTASGNTEWMGPVEANFTCSGFVVDPAGHIATAGHCVDPTDRETKSEMRALLIQDAVQNGDIPAEEEQSWIEHANSDQWAVEGKDAGSPIERVVEVIQPPSVPGRVLDQLTTAQVVDFQKFENGDNALLKVSGMAPLKPLVIAQKAPEPGRSLTAVGFPGIIGQSMDPSRLQQPSFKSGTASSQQVEPSGASKTEINADVSGGMSGGPTVDNETGEVLGVNSYGLRGETQAFNFITDATELRAFLDKNGVNLAAPAQKKSSPTWIWLAIGAAAALLIAGLVVVMLLLRRGKERQTPPPVAPLQPQNLAVAPPSTPAPPAGPVSPDSAAPPPNQSG